MTPPTSVRVGPYVFRVVRKPHYIAGTDSGDTLARKSRIRYTEDDHSAMQVRSTILHEVLHAVAHTAAISDEEKLNQEEWVSRIEAGLLGVLRDNPELVDYLTAPA